MNDLSPEAAAPAVRVVQGNPTPEEVAALVTVLLGLGSGGAGSPASRDQAPAWADPAARLRQPVHPGPGGWRRSALPR